MQGLYHTLSALGNAPEPVESVQLRMLGDVAGFISDALVELRDTFIASSSKVETIEPSDAEEEPSSAIADDLSEDKTPTSERKPEPVTTERLDEIMMGICTVASLIEVFPQYDPSDAKNVAAAIMREIWRTMEMLEFFTSDFKAAKNLEGNF